MSSNLGAGSQSEVFDVSFSDVMHGYVTFRNTPNQHSYVFRTVNGGNSWQQVLETPSGQSLAGITAISEDTAYVLSIGFTVPFILRTDNAGAQWNPVLGNVISSAGYMRTMFAFDASHLWAISDLSVFRYQPVTPPTITLPRSADTVQIGQTYQYDYTRTGMALHDSLVQGLSWMQLSPGRISGTASGNAGTYTIRVMVRDTVWQVASASYQLTVLPAPPPPLLLNQVTTPQLPRTSTTNK